MSSTRHGVSGKWDGLIEERDRLKDQVQGLSDHVERLVEECDRLLDAKELQLHELRDLLRDQPNEAWATVSGTVEVAQRRVEEAEARADIRPDSDEQEALDALQSYMAVVVHRWKLRANQGELLAAVHTLQGAVQQHLLHRIAPNNWASWWQESSP